MERPLGYEIVGRMYAEDGLMLSSYIHGDTFFCFGYLSVNHIQLVVWNLAICTQDRVQAVIRMECFPVPNE